MSSKTKSACNWQGDTQKTLQKVLLNPSFARLTLSLASDCGGLNISQYYTENIYLAQMVVVSPITFTTTEYVHPGPEKNFASRNTRLGDQLRQKIEAKSRRISFVLQKSVGRIQRNSIFEFQWVNQPLLPPKSTKILNFLGLCFNIRM